jgi:hypothetical protein
MIRDYFSSYYVSKLYSNLIKISFGLNRLNYIAFLSFTNSHLLLPPPPPPMEREDPIDLDADDEDLFEDEDEVEGRVDAEDPLD